MAFSHQELLTMLGERFESMLRSEREQSTQARKFYDAYGKEHAAVARVRRLHFAYRGPSDFDSCAHCNRFGGEVPYPCDTVKALDGALEESRATAVQEEA